MNFGIALVVLATGPSYHKYINPLRDSARKYFPDHELILWTDSLQDHGVFKYYTKDRGYPGTTLFRYHTFLQAEDFLGLFNHVFYCDIDMEFVAPVDLGEIIAPGITATRHPGYINLEGTCENRKESTAYVERSRHYFAGGFVGGPTADFLRMSRVIAHNIDTDLKHGILAIWNDESHLNRYLFDNPPAKVLGPEFCYPDPPAEAGFLKFWNHVKYTPNAPKLRVIQKDFCRVCNRPAEPIKNHCKEHAKQEHKVGIKIALRDGKEKITTLNEANFLCAEGYAIRVFGDKR